MNKRFFHMLNIIFSIVWTMIFLTIFFSSQPLSATFWWSVLGTAFGLVSITEIFKNEYMN
jgi:hypothetical protein